VSYLDNDTVGRGVKELHGSAGHMLKVWLVLKRMGLKVGSPPVPIDTANSTPSLVDLFSCGSTEGTFFVPIAHSQRFKEMKHDAARSIIQTTVRRWASSDSVVGCDPSGYLNFEEDEEAQLLVNCSNNYPLGLGFGGDGFAISDGKVVEIPWLPWVVWYCRQRELGDPQSALEAAEQIVISELNLTQVERQLLFVERPFHIGLQAVPMSDSELYEACELAKGLSGSEQIVEVKQIDFNSYNRKVRAMVPDLGSPNWLRANAKEDLQRVISKKEVAILLYGPPRTGKTRAIDLLISRDDPSRATIQLHDGWSYDQLIEGILPQAEGGWDWVPGPLLRAIKDGKKYIVLEEANRTSLVQALGEVFSLLEKQYRGKHYAITLRSGEKLWIEPDVVFLLTANNLDKSTEDLDDALIGRLSAIQFPPSAEELNELLVQNGLNEQKRQSLLEVFNAIQEIYPLGHGYFAEVRSGWSSDDVLFLYKTRIRPVILNYVGQIGETELRSIDNLIDTRINW